MTYKKIAESFISYEDSYKLLVETGNVEHFELCLDNDGLWKRLPLKWLFEYFSDREDYKKLTLLKKIIDEHFVADDETQKKLNSKLKKNYIKWIKKVF